MKTDNPHYSCLIYPISELRLAISPEVEKLIEKTVLKRKIVGRFFPDLSRIIDRQGRISKSDFLAVSRELSFQVLEIFQDGNLPLIIGGDNTMLLGVTDGIRKITFLNSLVCLSPRMGLSLSRKRKSLDEAVVAHLVGEGDRDIYAFSHITPLIEGQRVTICGWTKALRMEKHLSVSLGIFNWGLRKMRETGIAEIAEKIRDTALAGADLVNIHLDFRLFYDESSSSGGENIRKINLAELRDFIKPFKKSGKGIIWSLSHLNWESDFIRNRFNMILDLLLN